MLIRSALVIALRAEFESLIGGLQVTGV